MIKQNAGKEQLGSIAENFAHYNDDILFGENWNDDSIDLKTRCIITVVSLISQGIIDNSLKYHMENAKKNGVSRKEMVGIITHNAFYAGWPKAWAAFNLLKDVYQNDIEKTHGGVFGIGKPNDQFKDYFKGQSYLNLLTKVDDYLNIFNVTFEPGCRNNWHIHHSTSGGGQVLICIDGKGWYCEEGKEPLKMIPGTIVEIKPNVKHWHGASKDSWFSHLTFEYPGENTSNEWLEEVSDEIYNKLDDKE